MGETCGDTRYRGGSIYVDGVERVPFITTWRPQTTFGYSNGFNLEDHFKALKRQHRALSSTQAVQSTYSYGSLPRYIVRSGKTSFKLESIRDDSGSSSSRKQERRRKKSRDNDKTQTKFPSILGETEASGVPNTVTTQETRQFRLPRLGDPTKSSPLSGKLKQGDIRRAKSGNPQTFNKRNPQRLKKIDTTFTLDKTFKTRPTASDEDGQDVTSNLKINPKPPTASKDDLVSNVKRVSNLETDPEREAASTRGAVSNENAVSDIKTASNLETDPEQELTSETESKPKIEHDEKNEDNFEKDNMLEITVGNLVKLSLNQAVQETLEEEAINSGKQLVFE